MSQINLFSARVLKMAWRSMEPARGRLGKVGESAVSTRWQISQRCHLNLDWWTHFFIYPWLPQFQIAKQLNWLNPNSGNPNISSFLAEFSGSLAPQRMIAGTLPQMPRPRWSENFGFKKKTHGKCHVLWNDNFEVHFMRRFSGAGLGFWFWRTFIPSAAKMLEGLLSPSMAPDKQKMGWKMGLPKGKHVFANFFCNSYMSPNSVHPNMTFTKKQTWLKVYWYKPLATKELQIRLWCI